MARIAIGGMQHETNTFMPTVTDYDYFCERRDRPPLARGADVLDWLKGSSFGLSGFMGTIDKSHELVPLVWAGGGDWWPWSARSSLSIVCSTVCRGEWASCLRRENDDRALAPARGPGSRARARNAAPTGEPAAPAVGQLDLEEVIEARLAG